MVKEKLASFFRDIKQETINFFTVASFLLSIVIPLITLIFSHFNGFNLTIVQFIVVFMLLLATLIVGIRALKYRNLANDRMKITSETYHNLLHNARNVYFHVMHQHKTKQLTVSLLTDTYKAELQNVLDSLCGIMESFTKRDISACIKLIEYSNQTRRTGRNRDEVVSNDIRLSTFCRSTNSDSGRSEYEVANKRPIVLKENTDFFEIISTENTKNYFYQGNLPKYADELHKLGKAYNNTNPDWSRYYRSTIVVPIRIEFKLLYHQKKNDAYHVIGFLCVDSMYTDAFTSKQERYNVEVARSFADIVYVLLSQYRHYLTKLSIP